MKSEALIFDMASTVIDSMLMPLHAKAWAGLARQQALEAELPGPHVVSSVRVCSFYSFYNKLINTHFLGSLHVA